MQVHNRRMDGVEEGLELRGKKGRCGALKAKETREAGVGVMTQIAQWYLRERGMEAGQRQSGAAQQKV